MDNRLHPRAGASTLNSVTGEPTVILSDDPLRLPLPEAPVGLFVIDRELRFLAVNQRMAEMNGLAQAAHVGRGLIEALPWGHGEMISAAVRVLATGLPVDGLELPHDVNGETRCWLLHLAALRDDKGCVTAASGSLSDITARHLAVTLKLAVAAATDHRVRNILSIARGLVRLSATDSPHDVMQLTRAIDGRVMALGRLHSALAAERWEGADLRRLVERELSPYVSQASFAGPHLRLSAEAAQPLGLVFHELVTNAANFGALSVGKGRLTLQWRQGAQDIELLWTERGGPILAGPPGRTGLGTRLIDTNLAIPLSGGITRTWRAEGLEASIRIGAGHLRGASSLPAQ